MKKITKKQLSARQDELDKRLARIEFAKDVWLNEPKLKVFDQSVFDERDDIAKELLEVDLSSELTGSEYFHSNITSALLESGSKLVVCFVSDISELKALSNKRIEVITSLDTSFNDSDGYGWQYAIPINNQGEPLTAAEAGL